MIGFLRGDVFKKEDNQVLLDVGGVGYRVHMTTTGILSLKEDEPAFLYIHYQQKEDSVSLYGFLSELTQEIFEILIDLNGIGPKLAMGILSHMDEDSFLTAVKKGDLGAFTGIPGVGKKTAQRLLLELQDKVAHYEVEGQEDFDTVVNSSLAEDAKEALTFLGYTKGEVDKVLKQVLKRTTAEDVNQVIKEALKELGK